MNFKANVIINGIKPELIVGLHVCDQVYAVYGYNMTVTSVLDGKHSRASLHHVGYAFDLRTRNVAEDHLYRIEEDLRKSLPGDFDVVREKDHFHIEFQPKRP